MDIFIYILLGLGGLLFVTGICILNNRKLEIGALMGIYPMLWGGGGMLGLGGLLWCIQHLSIQTV